MPAAPAARRVRRRARRWRQGLGWGALLVGALLVAGGVGVVAMPLWSGWRTALAQRQLGRTFAVASPAAEARAAGLRPWNPLPGDVLARMVIPAIGVQSYVLEGLTYNPANWRALLRQGPAHLWHSALPGQPGEDVIFGHVNIWGSVFLHLGQLTPGDDVRLETSRGTYVYRVMGSQVIGARDDAALGAVGGPALLQLVTCTGSWDRERLVVTAALVSSPATPQDQTREAAAARTLVEGYLADQQDGASAAAAALWSTAALSSMRTDLGRPVPQGAHVVDAWVLGGGRVRVMVREQGPTGPLLLAYTVGGAPGDLQLTAARQVGPAVVQSLAGPPANLSPDQGDGGTLRCGPDRVTWSVGPVDVVRQDALRFLARSSAVVVRGADGQPLPGVMVPGLTMGTFPLACGDLTGEGSTTLVLGTVLDQPAGMREYMAYRLSATGAVLVADMWGSDLRLVPPSEPGPWSLLVSGPGGVQDWIYQGGRYRWQA